MTLRRGGLLALGAIGTFWALGGEWISIVHGVPENHFLDASVGLAFLSTGILAIDRRPGNAMGILMILFALTWFLGNWGNLRLEPLITLGLIGGWFGPPLLAHIALAYPTGRVRTGLDRGVLWLIYATAIGTSLWFALTWDPGAFGCGPCPRTWAPWPDRAASELARSINDRSGIVLVPLFLLAVALRWRRASRAERRDLAPLWIAVSLLALVYLIGAFASSDPSDPFAYLLWEIRGVLEIGIPIVFVWGLLSSRLARSAVGDLVLELEHPLPAGGLREVLARTLGDPSLEVAYPIADGERWVDAAGSSLALPEPDTAGRAVTMVERDDDPVAALIHDPALEAGLVRAAGAAAGMVIDNERLRAEVHAQLEEVRASRQRIVEAGDRERRRVERNLHDGAQAWRGSYATTTSS